MLSSLNVSLFIKIIIYKIITSRYLHECETWSPALRLYKNVALRKMLGPKTKVKRGKRKLLKKGLRGLCCTPNVIRVI